MTSSGTMSGSVQFNFILGALWAYLFRCDGGRAGDMLLDVIASGEDSEPVPVRLRLTPQEGNGAVTSGALARMAALESEEAFRHSNGLSRRVISKNSGAPTSSGLVVKHSEEGDSSRVEIAGATVLEVSSNGDGAMELSMAFSPDTLPEQQAGQIMSDFMVFLTGAIRDHRAPVEF